MASSYDQRLNCSKAQMCFFKILHTISSIPPLKEEAWSPNRGINIDLNLRFCSFDSQSFADNGSNESSIDQGNNETEAEAETETEIEAVREKSVDTKVQSFKVENNEVDHVESKTVSFTGKGQDSNYLDLLIEAARVLSAKDELNSEEDAGGLGCELKTTRRASEGSELLLPVVRSKRGRNQTLPYRFRDSVVEPLKRTVRNHRLSSTVHARKRLPASSTTT